MKTLRFPVPEDGTDVMVGGFPFRHEGEGD
jgi:hypothetical protein